MPRVTIDQITKQAECTERIRNICIIAHVDHGKTTLCDALISSNGIISERLAGQMRYMDNRKDEQEKLITMKCSSISLLFPPEVSPEGNYLINLIDSPGHVDFTGEVSSAVRLSDGALVVVDVAEGLCVQTVTVLRQAWNERVKPCLVLNKIDRLFTELDQSPEEAYYHLYKILESVNVVMAGLMTEEHVLSDDRSHQETDQIDDSNLYFSPELGNVIFASAADGWGFRIDHFAELYSKKFGMKKEALLRCLWGEYYLKLDRKAENKSAAIKIVTDSQGGKLPRLFVEFVLKNIHHLYRSVFFDLDIEKTRRIVKSLALEVTNREMSALERYSAKSGGGMKAYKDGGIRGVLQAIARKWLPLSAAILHMVVDQLPSPIDAQRHRIAKLWRSLPPSSPPALLHSIALLQTDLEQCNKESEHAVAFVSKVFAVPYEGGVLGDAGPRISTPSLKPSPSPSPSPPPSLNDNVDVDKPVTKEKGEEKGEEGGERFIGFTRLFCGRIRKGQRIYVLGPKFDPRHPDAFISSLIVSELYTLMGRALEPIECASAGMVFGIGGISSHILKTATLSTLPLIPTFSEVHFSQSIVRVAVEPENPGDMEILAKGLERLNQADASVEVLLEGRDQIISAAGELHLERCLRDLQEFAPIPLKISPPIVSFKETIVEAGPPLTHHMKSAGLSFSIRSLPLPSPISSFLQSHSDLISHLFGGEVGENKNSGEFAQFQNNLLSCMIKAGHSFSSQFSSIWSFGPNRNGPNMLFNRIPRYFDSPYWKSMCSSENAKELPEEEEGEEGGEREGKREGEGEEEEYSREERERIRLLASIDYAIVNGFQLATMAGPLCGEPLHATAFFIDDFHISSPSSDDLSSSYFKGLLTSSIANAFKLAFEKGAARLVEPFYHCDLNVSESMFGKASGVLFRRRGRITNNERKGIEGFTIEAVVPVVESFGLSEELMTKSSGAASVSMWFSHWETLEIDPKWEPTTADELEEFGSNAQARGDNIARQLIDNVRRRKGMYVEEKLVEQSDKQRTLSKKK